MCCSLVSLASRHGDEFPPLRRHDGHLFLENFIQHPMCSDSFGRTTMWIFTSVTSAVCSSLSAMPTNTLASSVFQRSHFRVPEFDRRETFMEYLAATMVPRNFTSCVSLFVVAHVHDHTPFPVPLRRHRAILVDDEAMFRQAFGNLACFSSAEKHMRIVLVMECLVAATGHLLRGHVVNYHPH